MIYNNFLNLLAKFCVIEKVKYSCFSLVVCDMSSLLKNFEKYLKEIRALSTV